MRPTEAAGSKPIDNQMSSMSRDGWVLACMTSLQGTWVMITMKRDTR
jgi:hypothetical protein